MVGKKVKTKGGRRCFPCCLLLDGMKGGEGGERDGKGDGWGQKDDECEKQIF